jgi:hypothetical protein
VYLQGDFQAYCDRMEQRGVRGCEPELVVATNIVRRSVGAWPLTLSLGYCLTGSVPSEVTWDIGLPPSFCARVTVGHLLSPLSHCLTVHPACSSLASQRVGHTMAVLLGKASLQSCGYAARGSLCNPRLKQSLRLGQLVWHPFHSTSSAQG